MKIIKRYHDGSKEQNGMGVCLIRTDCYDRSLSYFQKLFEEAKKDFPNLKPDDVTVVVYGGDTISGTAGIEFHPPDDVPDIYTKISFLPPKAA